jgi:membrane fusion protein, multidrug efflux system
MNPHSETMVPTAPPHALRLPGQLTRSSWVACARAPAALGCLALLLAALAGLLSGCTRAVSEPAPKPPPPTSVRVAHPRRGELRRRIVLPANVRAYQQATLYAKVAGYLKAITVDKGDRVHEGQLLADLEVPELLADQAKYRAEVAMTEVDYHRVDAAHKQAPDLVVQQVVDKARGTYEMAKANLARVETLLRYTRITAPFSGVITKRFVDPGAFIPTATSSSTSQSAALVTIADFSRVRVQVPVPEPEVPLIINGLPVQVSVEELPGRLFAGTVTRYANALDEATKTMLLEVDIANPREELRPGMYAKVEILIEHRVNALTVPANAVFLEDSKPSVFTVVAGKARKVPVTLGLTDAGAAEVLTGLEPGQAVILAGAPALSDGQAVAVEEVR